jgi:hypothetical protein
MTPKEVRPTLQKTIDILADACIDNTEQKLLAQDVIRDLKSR